MRVTDRLTAARCRGFVGRTLERQLFLDHLRISDDAVHLLHFSGIAGIGKSMLLSELLCECNSTGVPVIFLDALGLDPSPAAFLAALRQTAPEQLAGDPWQAFVARPGRRVLLVDACEHIAPLGDWLRNEFLPPLAGMLVVMAGQAPFPAEWRTDAGWRGLAHSVTLGNLSPQESHDFLAIRQVPDDQHDRVITFTHGHPLALSLVADAFDQRPGMDFHPDTALDVIAALVEHLIPGELSPQQRSGLQACSLVRSLTEDLLAAMLDTPDAHGAFESVRCFSFVAAGPFGLSLNDMARTAIAADLHWRNPDWYAELRRRARAHYQSHLQRAPVADQLRLILDYLYLDRHDPQLGPYLDWHETKALPRDTLHAADKPEIVAMVTRHEGEQSAALAAHWLDRQPQGVVVWRAERGRPAGFMQRIALHETSQADGARDQAVRAVKEYLEQHAPLRAGEQATLIRFWMDRDSYQSVSPLQSQLFGDSVLLLPATRPLAFTLFACAQPELWTPLVTFAGMQRLPGADFAVGGRNYGIFGHDWRVTPAVVWLDRLAASDASESPAESGAAASEGLVLNQSDFAVAVRWALRACNAPHELSGSPLLRSRLVLERSGAHATSAARVAALQSILHATVKSLNETHGGGKRYRALHASFFASAATQEQAAEALHLPFSTFRRHVQTGIGRVTEILWQQEIGGAN